MKYQDLQTLKNNMSGKSVCLFGAGLIGRTWAYDLLKSMGFVIDFYCDNNIDGGKVIKNGIKAISLETLYLLQDNCLVFVTAGVKNQDIIKSQLERNGIYNVVRVDFHFLSVFLDSLVKMNDVNIGEQFKAVLDDEKYLRGQFEYRVGYRLNLDDPKTFNEKLQWLKLHNRKPEYTRMVDKYEVKRFVEERIGSGYTIPTLGIWDSFDEIDFDKLPEQFVLKCTHDSGSIVIVKDKETLNKEEARRSLSAALQVNYFWMTREWPYKNVKRRIIAESYLSDFSEKELKDYKFFCFNGRVKMIQVDFDRFFDHKRNIYSREWEYIPLKIKYPTDSNRIIEKPKCLKEMINIAENLSISIPHVRVDFYIVNDRPIVGEMTFFHGGGYEKFAPQKWDEIFGDWIVLPEKG